MIFIPVAILAILILWVIALYNGLVRCRNTVNESWSQIDVELKRRHDLIPNLVEVVRAYAEHERTVLERVTQARSIAQRGADEQAEREVSAGLGQLFVVAEGYPTLRADANYRQLMDQLTTTEDRIQRVRRFFNGNVRDLNDRVEMFPTSIIAGLFGFTKRTYFEVEPSVRTAPDVGAALRQ